MFDRLKAADKAVAPLLEAGPDLLEACEHARSELRHTRFEVKAYPGLRAVADMLGPDEDAANAWLLEPPPYNLKKEARPVSMEAFDLSVSMIESLRKEADEGIELLMYLDDEYGEEGYRNESDEGG